MTPAHRARLVAALTLETGIPWRQYGRSARGVTAEGERQSVWYLEQSPVPSEAMLFVLPSGGSHYEALTRFVVVGRGWPERLAVDVAKKIKEVSDG